MADIRLPKRENIDFQSKKTFSNKDLIECSRGLLFGENNAQLPAPPMLMFDSISVSYSHLTLPTICSV